MKKQLAFTFVSIAFLCANGLANGQTHNAKAHAGDTVFPGSPEWLHAGSPRNSVTGEEVILIWGTDGTLHPIGYAIEDTGGSWLANTPENSKMVTDHLETKRLIAAVKEIMRESPDRIILWPAKARGVTTASPDTGYNPYKWLMHWTDSVARLYDDRYFLESVENYYRRPTRLDYYPTIHPIKS